MKYLSLFLIFIVGCYSSFFFIEGEPGVKTSVTVGTPILSWGYGRKGEISQQIKYEMKKQLIYTGIDHGVIQISYREFSGSDENLFARPAFSEELKYDINKVRLISFQDVRIRIDSADQSSIEYVIMNMPEDVANDNMLSTEKSIFGFSYNQRGEITSLEIGSRAAHAGLKTGDHLLSIQGPSLGHGDFIYLLHKAEEFPNQKYDIKLIRDTIITSVTIE